jgi:hypothetical protein
MLFDERPNTMTKEKDRQYNDQRKRQTIQWPKKKDSNIENTTQKYKDIEKPKTQLKPVWTQVLREGE